MIEQEPSHMMIQSNLTVNYVLLFMVWGAFSPSIAKKLLPHVSPKVQHVAGYVTMLVGVVLLLLYWTLWGYEFRWQ